MQIRLLDRIRYWSNDQDVNQLDWDAQLEHLRRDLENMYRTRKGAWLLDENYGLPDFQNIGVGFSTPQLDWLAGDIQATAEQFESRLKKVRVKSSADEADNFVFELTGIVEYSGREIDVSFALVLEPRGGVWVKRE